MKITRQSDRKSDAAPAEYFTGDVAVTPLFSTEDPGRAVGASVTFQPGARTNWHSHPLGQTLIVTDGAGRVQRDGGPVETITIGDVITFPAGERHWHGAAPDTSMTHIAIQESDGGKTADWAEAVSDDDYEGR